MITQENSLEFGLGALDLWANHDNFYKSISNGVHVSCEVIRTLRRFIDQASLAKAEGEITGLLDELRDLLRASRLSTIPDSKFHSWPWRVLRFDQLFRFREREAMDRLQQLTHEIDALISLADVTKEYGFTMPEIATGQMAVNGEQLTHPFIRKPIANPVSLDQNKRVLFLTGPNMAGKTTYLRAFATAVYFAHLGMGVPATGFRFVPAEHLFSSISLSDDLHRGVSYFRAEALRVKSIAQAVAAGRRVIAIMDEPFKGTNVKDAFDASQAILERFAGKADCLFMFSSHLIELSEKLAIADRIDCRYFDADETQSQLQFDYRLREGVSNQRLGMRVLQEEGIFDLLD